MKGYQGKFLRINLQDHTSEKEEWGDWIAQRFIGGTDRDAALLFQENKNVDTSSPDSLPLFIIDSLTGTQKKLRRPEV